MSGETQAIVANGIPLAIVAALYTAVTAALTPTALRERHRMSTLVFAFLSLFPILAVLTAVLAGYVLVEAKPLGDHLWIGLAAIVVAAFPPLAVLVQIGRGKRFLNRWAFLDREFDSVTDVSRRLGRASDGSTISLALLEQAVALEAVPLGAVDGRRTEFCAPLENNLFRAAFEAGLFGERQGYTNCQPTGRVGTEVHTSVAVLDVGADLQFIVNPGEAFPGLMLGSPWGIEDASCPARDNPPVPTWHASAKHRFQVGLGDDLIGYEKPAWSFVYEPPTFTAPDCNTDPHGHSHSLESEAVGPAASNAVRKYPGPPPTSSIVAPARVAYAPSWATESAASAV